MSRCPECGATLLESGVCPQRCDDCGGHFDAMVVRSRDNARGVDIVAEGERVCRPCFVARGGKLLSDINRERASAAHSAAPPRPGESPGSY